MIGAKRRKRRSKPRLNMSPRATGYEKPTTKYAKRLSPTTTREGKASQTLKDALPGLGGKPIRAPEPDIDDRLQPIALFSTCDDFIDATLKLVARKRLSGGDA